MPRPVDYSKWDNLDISDDEKDYHPNIDASLMIRIKREQRARREAEEEKKIADLKRLGTPQALAEVAKIESRRKLHVGNIGHVSESKTIINSKPEAPKPIPKGATEDEEISNMEKWIELYESVLDEYASTKELSKAESYLYDHSELLCDHACNHLLLKQLHLEMEGKSDAMILATRNYLILRNVLDLALEAKTTDARPMVQLFFKQVNTHPDRKQALHSETLSFAEKIKARALEKLQQAALEAQGTESDSPKKGEDPACDESELHCHKEEAAS